MLLEIQLRLTGMSWSRWTKVLEKLKSWPLWWSLYETTKVIWIYALRTLNISSKFWQSKCGRDISVWTTNVNLIVTLVFLQATQSRWIKFHGEFQSRCEADRLKDQYCHLIIQLIPWSRSVDLFAVLAISSHSICRKPPGLNLLLFMYRLITGCTFQSHIAKQPTFICWSMTRWRVFI